MEIRYSREMNHNYMIIEAPEEEPGYAVQMLSANAIEGLLRFRVRQTEAAREYYYEITSRQPLQRLLEKRTLSGQELRTILLRVLTVIGKVEEYLLREEQLLLDPAHIYLDPDRFAVELCLVPGHAEAVPQALSNLLKYLLERVDHQDREAVVMAYNLYQVSLKENYGTADLLRQLSGEDRIFSEQTFKEERDPQALDQWDRGSRLADYENGIREAGPECGPEREEEARWEKQPGIDQPRKTRRLEEKREESGKGKTFGKSREKPSLRLPLWIRVLGSAVFAGIVYWYVTGEKDIWMCAVCGGAGVIAGLREILAERKKESFQGWQRGHEKELESECSGAADEKMGTSGERAYLKKKAKVRKNEISLENESALQWENMQRKSSETSWQVYPESEEAYRKELQKEQEAQIERAREAGTRLLSDSREGEGRVRLEPFGTEGEVIQIPYVPFTLGKHRELADACIDRPTISRLHARIDRKEGVYILTDLNSTNGTSVNGYQLQANETVSLENGDSIYLADAGYKFWEVR